MNSPSLLHRAVEKRISDWKPGLSLGRLLGVLLLLLTSAASAQQKIDFKDHPFFKRLVGEWSSEGERKYADGNLVKVTETWTAELLGENAVSMEGTRDRGGQVSHYKWTFTVTDAGLIEASYQRDIGNADTQRYEVQAAEDGSRIEMTALGDNSSKSTITHAFKEGDPDTLESTMTRTDANGATLYSGTAVAKKKKKT
jgi:hypothetical protein